MIELNVTFVIQLVNFIIALFLVNTLLVRPVRNILNRRKETRDGLCAQIDGFIQQSETQMQHYEAALRSAREEGGGIRLQEREQGLRQQSEIIAAAQNDAAGLLLASQRKTAQEKQQAEKSISQYIQPLADEAVRKLMA